MRKIECLVISACWVGLSCFAAIGCIEPPAFPDDEAVQAQFPLAVPSEDLTCLTAPAYGEVVDDCYADSGYFEVYADPSTATSLFKLEHFEGGDPNCALFGMLKGDVGPGANEISGNGALILFPFFLVVKSSYACKVYDMEEECGLIACNWGLQLGPEPVDIRGIGIIPHRQEAFCTEWE